jgi:hypothetical protein
MISDQALIRLDNRRELRRSSKKGVTSVRER